jgi:hypothetical protein
MVDGGVIGGIAVIALGLRRRDRRRAAAPHAMPQRRARVERLDA